MLHTETIYYEKELVVDSSVWASVSEELGDRDDVDIRGVIFNAKALNPGVNLWNVYSGQKIRVRIPIKK